MKREIRKLVAKSVFSMIFVAFTFMAISSVWAEEILVYTALEDDEIPGYLNLLKNSHPDIDVKIVRDSTGIITAKLLAEKDNPQADVVWGTAATSLLVCDQNGMLEGYAPADLEKVRAEFRDSNPTPHWVGIKAWMTGFCVNSFEIKALGIPAPQSYDDLIKPIYKNQVVMPNPASSGTGFLTVSAILQMMGKDKGWAYLDKLHENIVQYTHSGSKPCKLAGSGESAIGISFGYRGIMQKQKGEPVETIFPKEGSGWDVESNALIKKGVIKKSSKIFLDWAISEPVMKEYAKVYPLTAYSTGVAVPEGYPAEPEKQLIKNDLQWAAANRTAILEEWSRRYESKSEPKK
ncbi:MAG: putative 2-aminoethylphosphonate ABC transporter substrate-binding protein [Desulfamplus sp.]|nr:putative 2-aminoethylphosphonate ABC transporter substrate-binding protein [Desulfamplus sp.]